MELPPSRWVDLDGPVHYVDHGGPDGGPLLVLVHGLGGSHVNWAAVAPVLARDHRVLALDLAGFGLTRGGGGRLTTVQANRDLLHRFVNEVAGAPAVVVGNSMGGLVTALLTATRPEAVAGAVLIDPALPVQLSSRPNPLVLALFAAYWTPGVGTALMRGRRRTRTPEQMAMETLRLCCVDPGRVDPEVVRAHIEFARSRGTYPSLEQEFVVATRSMLAVLARRGQLLGQLREVDRPVLVLQGEKDRLMPAPGVRAFAAELPSWRYEEAADTGHVPMLEAPDWTVERITDWLATEGAGAAEAARGAVRPSSLRSA
jgi:pimeloyl-ACP methyl ester carboxylesterase